MQATSLSQVTNLAASTAETTIVTADAAARNHLTGLIITSTDTVASVATIRDFRAFFVAITLSMRV